MIPSPNLDDRSFEDIVDEAIRLIPQYCPDWTNFNRADPGITLLELFAWMTEMVIYRLNRVPEKNYVAFLNLLGIQLQPPRPARALVVLGISDQTDQVKINAGTRLATKPSDDQSPLLFETDRDLLAVSNRLVRCMSQANQSYTDNTSFAEGRRGAFEVFGGARSIERYLYLGDSRFEAFGEDAILVLRFEAQGAGEDAFHELLEWEYWDGSRWRGLNRAPLELERNAVAFHGPARFQETEIEEIETWWVRGRLFEVPQSPDDTVIDLVSARLEVLGDGVEPEHALCNADEQLFQTLDLDKNFLPFGKSPSVDGTFYLACSEVLGQPDTVVRLEIELSDQTVAEPPRPSDDLVLRWEYHTGKRWKQLAEVKTADDDVKSKCDFVDGTKCFTQTGVISFRRPSDLEPSDVNGDVSRWIRCRIHRGGYGAPGTYELDADTWVWQDDNPLRPPHLKRLVFKFQEEPHHIAHCLVYNDFVYSDHTEVAATEYKPFQVFQPVAEESPTLYLGWEAPFPNDLCAVYFNVLRSDQRGGRSVLRGQAAESAGYVEQRVVWEYWNGKTWAPLAPDDHTDNFREAGFIEFLGPANQRKSRRFGDSLYWMRARLEMGGYEEPPRVDAIVLNATYASQVTTYQSTPLGSSIGAPNLAFRLPRAPVLDGEVILVREPERPKGSDLEALEARWGEGAVAKDADGGGFWVRWAATDSFYDATPTDRVYTKDIQTGEIRFGDGLRGSIPPKGDKNILAARYQTGGGSVGNVPARTIVSLKQNLAYVTEVTNPYPATGGSDMESVDEAKLRAPHLIKARNRAVTADDFEWLAREASSSVARVKCLPSTAREGEVMVIVVPKIPVDAGLDDKPVPTTELLKRVRQYIHDRKLLCTVVHVARPAYAELSVDIEFVRTQSGSSDRIKRGIERALRRTLHPLYGGRSGAGWDFGRDVLKIDLYQVVEEVAGVDFVDKIRIQDEDSGQQVEHIRIGDDALPFLVHVTATEKAHDRIL